VSAAALGPLFKLKCVLCKKIEERMAADIPDDGPMCSCGGVMTAERATTLHLKPNPKPRRRRR